MQTDEKRERITIRKLDGEDAINGGLVYGAFNSYGTPVGRRYRTAEECRKAFADAGFRNIAMPEATYAMSLRIELTGDADIPIDDEMLRFGLVDDEDYLEASNEVAESIRSIDCRRHGIQDAAVTPANSPRCYEYEDKEYGIYDQGTCDSFTITGTVFASIEAESPEDAVRKAMKLKEIPGVRIPGLMYPECRVTGATARGRESLHEVRMKVQSDVFRTPDAEKIAQSPDPARAFEEAAEEMRRKISAKSKLEDTAVTLSDVFADEEGMATLVFRKTGYMHLAVSALTQDEAEEKARRMLDDPSSEYCDCHLCPDSDAHARSDGKESEREERE